jgi:DNA-directed RNA polymerase specialized sigma24 family protein
MKPDNGAGEGKSADATTPASRIEPTEQQLQLLSEIMRDVARFHHLSQEDAQDFVRSCQLHLLEQQYDVFSVYEGRSSLRTYLIVVVKRMFLHWRKAKYGSGVLPLRP